MKSKIGRIWRRLKQLYVFLLPLRFNLVALGLLIFAFYLSDQGTDILRALTEKKERGFLVYLFVIMSNVLAYQVWYWSRHLLRYRPQTDKDDPRRDPMRDPIASDLPRLTTWTPRVLGLFVFLIEIFGFLHVGGEKVTIFLSLGGSAILYLIVVIWRRAVLPINDDRFGNAKSWHDFATVTLVMLAIAIVIEIGLFVWAYTHPVSWQHLGVAATLVLTIAVWIPIGTLFVGFGESGRFPIFTALLLWAVLISPTTDNHVITRAGNAGPRRDLQAAFDAWYQRVAQLPHPPNQPIPVIIVATEGGGIRAAYWTASALTYVTDAVPGFADHCFAVSGVSGGSLGALMYNAILARRLDDLHVAPDDPRPLLTILGPTPNLRPEVHATLQFDALSGTLAALAQPDLAQRFVPGAFLPDRQAALESGWETAWADAHGGNKLFGRPFLATMNAHHQLPNLFLNGTVVESGLRIITSNVVTHPKVPSPQMFFFRDAYDAFDELKFDIPMSTAAGMSARFTYISPAGKIPYTRGGDTTHRRVPVPCTTTDTEPNPNYKRKLFGHVVDGGYFEVSAAVTAAELVDFVLQQQKPPHGYNVEPFVVLIDHWSTMAKGNCPNVEMPFCPAPGMCGPNEPKKVERFANEVLSPLRAVLSARDARGQQAIGDIAQRMGNNIVELRLAPRRFNDVALPLGWVLSDAAMEAIDNAITDGKGKTTQAGNVAGVDNIRKRIAGQAIKQPDCSRALCNDATTEKGPTY